MGKVVILHHDEDDCSTVYRVVGPFKNKKAAQRYQETKGMGTWGEEIMDIEQPKKS